MHPRDPYASGPRGERACIRAINLVAIKSSRGATRTTRSGQSCYLRPTAPSLFGAVYETVGVVTRGFTIAEPVLAGQLSDWAFGPDVGAVNVAGYKWVSH